LVRHHVSWAQRDCSPVPPPGAAPWSGRHEYPPLLPACCVLCWRRCCCSMRTARPVDPALLSQVPDFRRHGNRLPARPLGSSAWAHADHLRPAGQVMMTLTHRAQCGRSWPRHRLAPGSHGLAAAGGGRLVGGWPCARFVAGGSSSRLMRVACGSDILTTCMY